MPVFTRIVLKVNKEDDLVVARGVKAGEMLNVFGHRDIYDGYKVQFETRSKKFSPPTNFPPK